MKKNIQPPFALIRQAISHGKFEDKATRTHLVGLLDDMERELDISSFEFESDNTTASQEALQNHLIELLTSSEDEIQREEAKEPHVVRSGGDIDDDEDSD